MPPSSIDRLIKAEKDVWIFAKPKDVFWIFPVSSLSRGPGRPRWNVADASFPKSDYNKVIHNKLNIRNNSRPFNGRKLSSILSSSVQVESSLGQQKHIRWTISHICFFLLLLFSWFFFVFFLQELLGSAVTVKYQQALTWLMFLWTAIMINSPPGESKWTGGEVAECSFLFISVFFCFFYQHRASEPHVFTVKW